MARIVFAQNGFYEMVGIAYLSAVLKNDGQEVFLISGFDTGRVAKKVIALNPDIVALSCSTGFHRWYIDLAGIIKQYRNDVKILFGGPHPTFFPEIIEHPNVDMICLGEGEGAIVDLARFVDNRMNDIVISNLWIKTDDGVIKNSLRPLIQDLDSLEFPDWSIYYSAYPYMLKNRMYLVSSRGCPFIRNALINCA